MALQCEEVCGGGEEKSTQSEKVQPERYKGEKKKRKVQGKPGESSVLKPREYSVSEGQGQVVLRCQKGEGWRFNLSNVKVINDLMRVLVELVGLQP